MVGGGYVGMYTALRLQRRLRKEIGAGRAEIVVVSPDPYMTYQPFLPEAAAGSIAPAHVVVPLRRVLPDCTVIVGQARRVDHARRTAVLTTLATRHENNGDLGLPYDVLVLAPGSVSRTLPIPGLAELGDVAGDVEFREGMVALNTVDAATPSVVVRRIGEPIQSDTELMSRLRRAGLRPNTPVSITRVGGRVVIGTGSDATELDDLVASHVFVADPAQLLSQA